MVFVDRTIRMRPIDRGDMQAWLGVLCKFNKENDGSDEDGDEAISGDGSDVD